MARIYFPSLNLIVRWFSCKFISRKQCNTLCHAYSKTEDVRAHIHYK
jgi:hypothetical protein